MGTAEVIVTARLVIMEWSKTNQYNSFNSVAKGMSYYPQYKNILAWMEGKEKLGPPIEVNLDIFAECNLNCYFCIGQRYLVDHRDEVGPMRQLPTQYMLRLVDFLADWGVRGLCISGGGEPSLHKGLPQVIGRAAPNMDVAVVTNAVDLSYVFVSVLAYCRWVALSIDAATPGTYLKVKGRDKFSDAIFNVKELVARRNFFQSNVDLCFKFLILPENQYEIYDACKLAKQLGVQDFHVRPADFERADIKGHKKLELDREAILEQFERCHEEETEDFHVYTVTHKFSDSFHVKHEFSECLATPLVLPILQDGNAYLCVDKKLEADFRLGSAYPDPAKILDWWGSDEHRRLINNVDIDKCSRCTWSGYQSQIKAIESDSMSLSFP